MKGSRRFRFFAGFRPSDPRESTTFRPSSKNPPVHPGIHPSARPYGFRLSAYLSCPFLCFFSLYLLIYYIYNVYTNFSPSTQKIYVFLKESPFKPISPSVHPSKPPQFRLSQQFNIHLTQIKPSERFLGI